MKNFKKGVSIFMAAAMLCSLSAVSAFAEDMAAEETEASTEAEGAAGTGSSFEWPEGATLTYFDGTGTYTIGAPDENGVRTFTKEVDGVKQYCTFSATNQETGADSVNSLVSNIFLSILEAPESFFNWQDCE